MRRVESLLVLLAASALGGCMRIYPDPELPDVEVEWFDSDCRDAGGEVEVSLIGIDDTSFRADQTVPCLDVHAAFADIARERYRLEATLHTPSGDMVSSQPEELDLRNGLDKRLSLFFGDLENVHVAWTFDMGATCQSLAADLVIVEFSSAMFPQPFNLGASCDYAQLSGFIPDGIYTAVARALSDMTTVAESPRSPEIMISFRSFADVGTLVLSPL